MLARILEENGLAAAPIGVLPMLAASIDDGLAWCLLALIIAIAKSESLASGLLPIIGAIGFFATCFFVLRPLLSFATRKAEGCGALNQEEFALVLVLLLAAIWLTDRIGIYSVFGGFALGVCMPRKTILLRDIRAHMYQFIVVFFLPMFFANSGLNTNLAAVFSTSLFLPFVVILFASFLTKYVFRTAAMRANGFGWRESSAIGGLFNARGLILLIFANIGVAHGLINGDVFTMLMIIAILTTAAAMPIFNWSLRGTPLLANSPADDLVEAHEISRTIQTSFADAPAL
jgi:Kef-type K+ transport system membrane component KefB